MWQEVENDVKTKLTTVHLDGQDKARRIYGTQLQLERNDNQAAKAFQQAAQLRLVRPTLSFR
jgi:hypothetical protein